MDQPGPGAPDRAAFERLIEEYADRIYNVTFRITADASDAEDAMQEAFESAFRSWSSFRGEASQATWLYRIAVNAALMRVRARRPAEYLVELSAVGELRDWSDEFARLAEQTELHELLLTGLSQLEPDLRAALVLRDIHGLSTAEAAETLEISEAALKSRLHRARVLLRQHLAEHFPGR